MIILVLDEKISEFKRSFPNIITMWSLTDVEIAQLCAADQMSMTFGSRPADWVVGGHDDAKGGYPASIPTEKQYVRISHI